MNDYIEFIPYSYYFGTLGYFSTIKNPKNHPYDNVMCEQIKKTEHKYAQYDLLLGDDGSYTLRSYNTLVAHISSNGYISCNGTYSKTTAKHIGYFAKFINNRFNLDIPINYYSFKQCYADNVAYNVFTLEIVKL